MSRFDPIVLVPVYNHEHAIASVVEGVLAQEVACLLVDDGSSPACAQTLRDLAARHAGRVRLLRLPENQGKGGAVMAGLAAAATYGHTHALQIDADSQHDTGHIPEFLALARDNPDAMVCGTPRYDDTVPLGRLVGRYLTHVWVWINTLSFGIRDSMCGLRVYPLASVMTLLGEERLGRRMEFDTEVLVHLSWRGVPIMNLATPVTYPADGVSHFQPWHDNLLISRMHARLFFGMLWRLPRLLRRKAGLA